MRELRVGDGSLEAVLLPEAGARLHRLRAFGHDLLRTPSDPADHLRDPIIWGGYLMAPWCNRLAAGPTAVDGRTLRLASNFPDGSAIHGQVYATPWTITGAASCSVGAGGDGWPWPYDVTLSAVALDASLSLRWRLTNLADEPMPAGIGFHPWWRRPVELRVDAGLAYASNITPAPIRGRSAVRSTSAAWLHQPMAWTAPGPMRRSRGGAGLAGARGARHHRGLAQRAIRGGGDATGHGRDRRRAADPCARWAATPAEWPARWPGLAAGGRDAGARPRDSRQPWMSRAAIRRSATRPARRCRRRCTRCRRSRRREPGTPRCWARVRARKPSTSRLYIEKADAMSTASCTSPSLAPASWAASTSASRQAQRSLPDGAGDVQQGRHLGSTPSDEPALITSITGSSSVGVLALQQGAGEGAVGVHAEEAVVGGRDRGGQHLPLVALDGGAREVIDQQLVGQAAQMDAQAGRQPHGDADPGHVGQPTDDGLFLGARQALVVSGRCRSSSDGRLRILSDRDSPNPHHRRRHLPARPAEHPRSAPARGGGDHHRPRPGPGRAAFRGQRAPDPGGHRDLRHPGDRAHLPAVARLRLARQRDADRQRRRPHPARRRARRPTSPGPPNWYVFAGGRRPLAAVEVRHQVPRLARLQPVEHRAGRRLHRARQLPRRAARLLVGAARQPLDARRLRGDHRRRAS